MDRLRLSLWLWIAAALMALGLSAPAAAAHRNGAVVTSRCHAHSDADRTAEAMIAAREWNCTGAGWKADAPVAWLRFDATDWRGGPVPQHFFTRTARHQTITIYALDRSGVLRGQSFAESDGRAFAGGPVFRLPLPAITPATEAVLVRIDRPHSIPLLTEAGLAPVRSQQVYSWVLNGRYKGGHITRHFGRPEEGWHAVQLEMAWSAYMDEAPPFALDGPGTVAGGTARLRPLLRDCLGAALRWARGG